VGFSNRIAIVTVISSKSKSSLVFAALFALESFCRSLNSTVLSVQAYDILGSAAKVSIISVVVSMAVLSTTLMLPVFFGFLRRRWAYSAGIIGVVISAAALASFTLEGQVLGTYFRNASAALLNVTLSLYIMDHVKRQDLVRTESMRLTLSTLSWMVGPALGIFLYDRYGSFGPQILVAFASTILLCVFWYVKLNDPELLPAGTIKGRNPLHYVKQFVRQPRLRLAWTIAFGRSCFWATLFIYGPLMLLEGGASKQFGGVVISLSQASLFLAVAYGKLSQRVGVRPVVTSCLALSGMFALLAGLSGTHLPYLSAGFLLAGAIACVGLDAVGGIPYLRAVKSRQRQSLTPVYRTFIELSELLPGLVFAFALTFFPIPIVFGLLGAFLFIVAGISWQYLPKSM
jgi:MFS family permease